MRSTRKASDPRAPSRPSLKVLVPLKPTEEITSKLILNDFVFPFVKIRAFCNLRNVSSNISSSYFMTKFYSIN